MLSIVYCWSRYRDIAFWWKYFLNPDMMAFNNNPLGMAAIGSGSVLSEIPRMSMQLSWGWSQEQKGYSISAEGLSDSLHCAANPMNHVGKTMPVARWPSAATPSFHLSKPAVRGEDDIIYRKNLPTFSDDEVLESAGMSIEAELLQSAANKKHHAILVRRSKATGERRCPRPGCFRRGTSEWRRRQQVDVRWSFGPGPEPPGG